MIDPLPDHALRRLLDDAAPLLDELRASGNRSTRYRVIRELGRGGMGVVYEALDQELGRNVALKVIAPRAGGDAVARARFVREARAAARLRHPNIAAVYDADEHAISMQLIGGGSLLEQPKDDIRRLVTFVRDAALAVHHAHEHGIIHRDLKPQNLLVDGDRVFVTDFGLAKETSVDASLSLSGHVLGTPGFMAPEQASGRTHEVDARTDVYGLGATLYHLLAGRPPFLETRLTPLLRRIADDDPPSVRSLNQDVAHDLATVVHRAIEKEPRRRYGSADDLAKDLSRWLDGRPVLARRPSLVYRLGKLARRRPALILVTALSLALAIAGLFSLNAATGRRAAEEALDLAESVEAVIADAEMHWRLGENEQAFARLDEGIRACETFLAGSDVAVAHLLHGRLLRRRARVDEARASLDRALTLDPSLVAARFERGLLAAGMLATVLAQKAPPRSIDETAHMPPPLRAVHQGALRDLEVAVANSRSLRRIDAELARAALHHLQGERALATRHYEEVCRLDPTRVEARLGLSQLALAEGDGEGAWHLVLSALDLYRGFGPAYLARGTTSVASPLESARDVVSRAVDQHALTAANQRIESGDRSPDALFDRASLRLEIADIEGALADFTSALRISPDDAMAHGHRALIQMRRAATALAEAREDDALAAFDAAIADCRTALVLAPHLAGAWNNSGVCHLEKDRILARRGDDEGAARERVAAAADLDAAIAQGPRFALARLNRALLARRQAEDALHRRELVLATDALERARDDLSVVLSLNPGDPRARAGSALLDRLDARRALLALDPVESGR